MVVVIHLREMVAEIQGSLTGTNAHLTGGSANEIIQGEETTTEDFQDLNSIHCLNKCWMNMETMVGARETKIWHQTSTLE